MCIGKNMLTVHHEVGKRKQHNTAWYVPKKLAFEPIEYYEYRLAPARAASKAKGSEHLESATFSGRPTSLVGTDSITHVLLDCLHHYTPGTRRGVCIHSTRKQVDIHVGKYRMAGYVLKSVLHL